MGETLNSYTYEDIQEKLVYKNKGDHRLQTVLSTFDRFNITEGSFNLLNLKIIGELSEEIIDDELIHRSKTKNR